MRGGSSSDQIDRLVKMLAISDNVPDRDVRRLRHSRRPDAAGERVLILGGRRFLVIYDEDGRQDIVAMEDGPIKDAVARSARSVAAVFHANSLEKQNGGVTLNHEVAAEKFGFVPSTRFGDQPTAATGTAFVVGERHLLTAGHNISEGNKKVKRFVFGYEVDSRGAARLQVPKEWVFTPVRLQKVEDARGADWALVEVDRALDRDPLHLSTKPVEKEDRVYYIGFPRGLPIKYAGGARVMDPGTGPFFKANLDTFKGCSGAPVFDKDNNVVGIHVRGIEESASVAGGWTDRKVVTGEGDAQGEEVTKISALPQELLRMLQDTPRRAQA